MFEFILKQLKSKKGFTLVELVVVIAILGILAAIAVPKLGKSQQNAKISADQATARTIISALNMAVAAGDVSVDYTNETIKTAKVVGEIAKDTDVTPQNLATMGYLDEKFVSNLQSDSSKQFTFDFDKGEVIVTDGTDTLYPAP